MSVAAIIFDFDGTLVDTMPLHYEAYRQVFSSVGIELTAEGFQAAIGGNAREAIPKFLAGRNCPLSVEEIHSRKKTLAAQFFAERPIAVLASAALLPVLIGKYKLALASSGSRPGIEAILKRLDWQKYFDVVITGEDAKQGKPAPDLFLLAAERMSVTPEACFVFEDTDAGVEAAQRAGMGLFDVRRACAAISEAGLA